MSQGKPDPTRADIYEFKPEDSFEDAVTLMIEGHNNTLKEHGLSPIEKGHFVRVRVFFPFEGDRPPDFTYSLLDRLVYDGERAVSPYKGSPEIETVGRFAHVPMDESGQFAKNDPVSLQIGAYGEGKVIAHEASETATLDGGCESLDLTGLEDTLDETEGEG